MDSPEPVQRIPSHRGIHQRFNGTMHISARVEYAMKALTAAYDEGPSRLVKSDAIAREQEIPSKFLEKILRSLRHAGIVASQRGADGGFRLAKPPAEVSVADVIRALDGPLAAVREVWIATRAAVRDVLEHVTLEDIAAGAMPGPVNDLLEAPGAWERR